MTRKKTQEQLALPEIEPAFSLEIQATPEAAISNQGIAPQAQRTRSKRPAASKNETTEPRRSTTSRRKRQSDGETPPPAVANVAVDEASLPARSYNRPAVPGPAQIQLRAEGRLLHIHLLGEPVVEWRSTERLCAGYTADGSLADLQIPDLARHLPAHPPGDPALRARIDALQDELLFLKTGLALVLAGVIWLLLR